jgi:hypothetical protein
MINIFLSEEFIHSSITIMEDNQSVIKIAHNSEDRKRIRYINIRYHFIRQLADTLIKLLPIIDYTRFMDGIGLTNRLLDMEEPDVSI